MRGGLDFHHIVCQMTAISYAYVREGQGVEIHATGVQKSQRLAAVTVSVEPFHEKIFFCASELRHGERIRHLDLHFRGEAPCLSDPRVSCKRIICVLRIT